MKVAHGSLYIWGMYDPKERAVSLPSLIWHLWQEHITLIHSLKTKTKSGEREPSKTKSSCKAELKMSILDNNGKPKMSCVHCCWRLLRTSDQRRSSLREAPLWPSWPFHSSLERHFQLWPQGPVSSGASFPAVPMHSHSCWKVSWSLWIKLSPIPCEGLHLSVCGGGFLISLAALPARLTVIWCVLWLNNRSLAVGTKKFHWMKLLTSDTWSLCLLLNVFRTSSLLTKTRAHALPGVSHPAETYLSWHRVGHVSVS